MVYEYSYGIIPLKREGDKWMVLLIHHSSAHFWGFPKGHAEKGEMPKTAAIRELKEETNLDVIHFFSDSIIEERYHYTFRDKHINKTVGYFVAEVAGDLMLQDEEVSGSKWVPLDKAIDHLTYDTDKAVLNSAKKDIK